MASLIDSTYFYSHVCKSSMKTRSFVWPLLPSNQSTFARNFEKGPKLISRTIAWTDSPKNFEIHFRNIIWKQHHQQLSQRFIPSTLICAQSYNANHSFWTNGRVRPRKVKGGHTCTWMADSPPLGPLSPNSLLTNWVVLASRRCNLWTGLLRSPFCGLRVTVETRPPFPGINLSTRLNGHLPLDLFRN